MELPRLRSEGEGVSAVCCLVVVLYVWESTQPVIQQGVVFVSRSTDPCFVRCYVMSDLI